MNIARLLLLLAPLLLSACAFAYPDRIHYVWDAETSQPCTECAPAFEEGPLIGVALSGGGSRSAVFAAAGLEALHEHGLLSQVTHVSSVSGGGFAAAWHVLHRPDLCEAESDAAVRPICEGDPFAAFQDAMRRNYLGDVARRELARPLRFGSPTRRVSSLAEALDRQFIGGARFADLPPSPILLVNASRYDDGRRFVFSNLALPDAPGPGPLADPRVRAASFSLPGCPAATPGELDLSLAVATSAAFPFVLGPATFAAPADCAGEDTVYWHLGDGGVIENKGIETLEEVALREIDEGDAARVLLINLDAEFLADPENFFADDNLSIWTSNPARIVDVAMERGRGYHDLVWADVRASAPVPFALVSIRYTDAALGSWPETCRGDPDAIAAAIAAVPTSLGISACDADLMEAAAHQLVHAALNARLDELRAQGFSLRRIEAH